MQTYCGTPITMAPEILLRQQYDFKCDIWSLGIITYQLVYGLPPFMPSTGGGILDLMEVIQKS
jgi:serine/threonine-protein kinase ULK/ATG1